VPKILENPREIILCSAKKLIYNEGYDNMTMRKISDECGIGLGTIYNYFPNKINLAFQIMQDFWNEYLVMVDKIDATEHDFFEKIRRIFEQFESFVDMFMELLSRINSDKMKSYKKEEMEGRKDISEKLIRKVEKMLSDSGLNITVQEMTNNELAKFIVQNLVMMSQFKGFEYCTFEKIIKKLMI
jgi:Transcriptional regulator